MSTEEKAVAKFEERFPLMKMTEDEVGKFVQLSVDELGLTTTDFDRIKVPSGGALAWEVPDENGEPTYAKEIDGIILRTRRVRAYWSTPFEEGGGDPPDCKSPDSVTGYGKPGGNCGACPLAEFGSAPGRDGRPSRAQACQQRLFVFLLRPQRRLPILISLPPTSIQVGRKFIQRMWDRGIHPQRVVTHWALEGDKNKDGIDYAKAKPRIGDHLSEDMMRRCMAYAAALQPLFDREEIEQREYEAA